MIRRIHVIFRLAAPAGSREVVERVHRMYAMRCPIYRSLYKAIDITTEVKLEEEA